MVQSNYLSNYGTRSPKNMKHVFSSCLIFCLGSFTFCQKRYFQVREVKLVPSKISTCRCQSVLLAAGMARSRQQTTLEAHIHILPNRSQIKSLRQKLRKVENVPSTKELLHDTRMLPCLENRELLCVLPFFRMKGVKTPQTLWATSEHLCCKLVRSKT